MLVAGGPPLIALPHLSVHCCPSLVKMVAQFHPIRTTCPPPTSTHPQTGLAPDSERTRCLPDTHHPCCALYYAPRCISAQLFPLRHRCRHRRRGAGWRRPRRVCNSDYQRERDSDKSEKLKLRSAGAPQGRAPGCSAAVPPIAGRAQRLGRQARCRCTGLSQLPQHTHTEAGATGVVVLSLLQCIAAVLPGVASRRHAAVCVPQGRVERRSEDWRAG